MKNKGGDKMYKFETINGNYGTIKASSLDEALSIICKRYGISYYEVELTIA